MKDATIYITTLRDYKRLIGNKLGRSNSSEMEQILNDLQLTMTSINEFITRVHNDAEWYSEKVIWRGERHMTLFGNKYKEEIEVLKKIIKDKDKIIASKDEILQYKDRTTDGIKLIFDKVDRTETSKSLMTQTILTGLRENVSNMICSEMLEYVPNVDYYDKLEREVKSLKFKLSNSEKKNKSILEYKTIDNRFDLLQKLCSSIDTFITEEEDVFERKVDSTLINKKILEYGSAFGVKSDRMAYNIIMILKILYGNEYASHIPLLRLTDIEHVLEQLNKYESESCKERIIDQFLNEKMNHRTVTDEVNMKFKTYIDLHVEIAKNATLCEIFRKFTLRSIKLNSKVKLLLETIKDSLVLVNDKYDEELTRLSIENKRLKNDINQLILDDKDKTIRELQIEAASLRLENEALRYKKGGE